MNKKSKMIIIALLFLVLAFFLFVVVKKYYVLERNIDVSKNITWTLFSWDVSSIKIDTETWVVSMNDIEKYKNMVENMQYRRFSPPNQPTTNAQTYSERSNILNDYLKDNNFYFRISSKISSWYLFIKTKYPLKNNDMFFYRHNSNAGNWLKVSWKIRKSLNLIEWSDQEFLFNLNSIPIKTYYWSKNLNYNWLNQLNNNEQLQFIWWYVVSFDWNKIEEITIAWE